MVSSQPAHTLAHGASELPKDPQCLSSIHVRDFECRAAVTGRALSSLWSRELPHADVVRSLSPSWRYSACSLVNDVSPWVWVQTEHKNQGASSPKSRFPEPAVSCVIRECKPLNSFNDVYKFSKRGNQLYQHEVSKIIQTRYVKHNMEESFLSLHFMYYGGK